MRAFTFFSICLLTSTALIVIFKIDAAAAAGECKANNEACNSTMERCCNHTRVCAKGFCKKCTRLDKPCDTTKDNTCCPPTVCFKGKCQKPGVDNCLKPCDTATTCCNYGSHVNSYCEAVIGGSNHKACVYCAQALKNCKDVACCDTIPGKERSTNRNNGDGIQCRTVYYEGVKQQVCTTPCFKLYLQNCEDKDGYTTKTKVYSECKKDSATYCKSSKDKAPAGECGLTGRKCGNDGDLKCCSKDFACDKHSGKCMRTCYNKGEYTDPDNHACDPDQCCNFNFKVAQCGCSGKTATCC